MLLLGIDLGTSFIKVSVVDAHTRQVLTTVQHPDAEMPVTALQTGWAEQPAPTWWLMVQQAILKAHATKTYNPHHIAAIGIAYQMHGLVCVNKEGRVLRDAIIWSDSRAIAIGEKAWQAIGKQKALARLLNAPGNFTASKLAWVQRFEPEVYEAIHHVLLPGDYIAQQLTGEATTTVAALSEGIFWDFVSNQLSEDLFYHFEFNKAIIPPIQPLFGSHGAVTADAAGKLGLKQGIPVSYKAGDQPNNALALNVMEPGEVAATAGTSGVVYGVSNLLTFDQHARINSFAHVNHKAGQWQRPAVSGATKQRNDSRIGILLCVNGCGIMNNYVRQYFSQGLSDEAINRYAAAVPPGSDGLRVLPFGNGAERMLFNKNIGASIHRMQLTRHTPVHLFRAVQEGIAFALCYGLDLLRQNGTNPRVVRAGLSNLFLSAVFTRAFVNTSGVCVELYKTDGSVGAALGAGMGAGLYKTAAEALGSLQKTAVIEPDHNYAYGPAYADWKRILEQQVQFAADAQSI